MGNPHEERFVTYYGLLFRDADWTRELNVPGKARRLDLVHFGGGDVSLLGVLAPLVQGRVLLWEHQSRALNLQSFSKAMMALGWAATQYHSRASGERSELRTKMQQQPRAPVLVVYAPSLAASCQPLFEAVLPGVWRHGHAEVWGAPLLLCVAYASLPDVPGTGALRCFAQGAAAEEGASSEGAAGGASLGDKKFGLAALLDDPDFPTTLKESIVEDIMNQRIETGLADQRTAAQRVRDQGRDEGRDEGRKEVLGQLRALVAQGVVAPEVLYALEQRSDSVGSTDT